jgi:hypothetical protein
MIERYTEIKIYAARDYGYLVEDTRKDIACEWKTLLSKKLNYET